MVKTFFKIIGLLIAGAVVWIAYFVWTTHPNRFAVDEIQRVLETTDFDEIHELLAERGYSVNTYIYYALADVYSNGSGVNHTLPSVDIRNQIKGLCGEICDVTYGWRQVELPLGFLHNFAFVIVRTDAGAQHVLTDHANYAMILP